MPILFEVRGLPKSGSAQAGDWTAGMDELLGVRTGVVVQCAGGTLRIPSSSGAIACDVEGREVRRWEAAGDHFANWIEAVRSRRRGDLCAELESGVHSSALVHLGNASQRVGRPLNKPTLLAELTSSSTLMHATEQLLSTSMRTAWTSPSAR